MRDNFVYISTDLIHNMVVARGINSADFVKGLKRIPKNIILLNDDRKHANGLNAHTKFSTIQGATAVRSYLLNNRIHDKKIVDYQNNEDLDELMDNEIADLLYLSHMGFPLRNAFSSKLHNHYIYMMIAHFTRIYYRNLTDFQAVLNVCMQRHMLAVIEKYSPVLSRGASVLEKISHHTTMIMTKVPTKILQRLVKMTEDGVIIAFDRAHNLKHQHLYEIPLLVERYPDTQSTWYYQQDIYQNARQVGKLWYYSVQQKWELRL